MKKKRIKLNTDIKGMREKKSAISFDFPREARMRFLGYNYGQHLFLDNTLNPVPGPPAFRGEIRIPVRLHNWKPKTKMGKMRNFSLRVDSLDYIVGTAPFMIKAEFLGHYFEHNKDTDLELRVIIDAWLMSPELLDTARLEFSLTLIGEENSADPSFFASMMEENHNNPQLPIWTRTHASWNVKFKLYYDLEEFERNVAATLRWHSERIHWFQQQVRLLDLNKLALNDPAGFSYLQKVLPTEQIPEILSTTLLDHLEQARYITTALKNLVRSYQQTLKSFLDTTHNLDQIMSINLSDSTFQENVAPREVFSKKFQQRLDVFQRIIKTYENIKLDKLSQLLDIDKHELEMWLLTLAEHHQCFRIRDNTLIILHDAVDTALLNQLDEKFMEWELFERSSKPKFNI